MFAAEVNFDEDLNFGVEKDADNFYEDESLTRDVHSLQLCDFNLRENCWSKCLLVRECVK